MMVRRGLAVLLSALLAVPAGASPSTVSPAASTPIGTFSYSEFTVVGGAGALAGTTVFSGDMIEVGPRGSAWILLNGGNQVRVSSESRLRLKELAAGAKHVELEMLAGAARFRTSETAQVVARLADATVRAKGAKPAVGIISVLSRTRAIVSAEKGELLLSAAYSGKNVTLHEGETAELTLAAPPNPQGGGAGGASNAGIYGVVIVAIALGIGLTIALVKDKKGLTDQEKQNLVSPFKFP